MSYQSSFLRFCSLFVALFVLFSSLSCVPVMAQTNEPSYFDGQEVPLINLGSGVMLLAEMNGFEYVQRYNDGSNSINFDSSIPKGTNIEYLYVQINFPDTIPRGQIFDLTVRLTHNKATGFIANAMTLYEQGQSKSKSIKGFLTYDHSDGETILRFKDVTADFIASHCILRYEYSGYSTSAAFVHNVASINLEYVPETGLISGILQAITNLPSLIASAFGSLFDSVIEFLDYVWQAIIDVGDLIGGFIIDLGESIAEGLDYLGTRLLDGIKNLFVPTSDDIASMKESWDSLLEDRFGALYEVIALIDNYANTFTSSGSQNTIQLPVISIPLGDTQFSFGGQSVQVIPTGFTVLITPLKMITSILATCLFVNGLRNRFEKVVGNE